MREPDLAIVDVRLPPTFTDEGIRAAIELRERHPGVGILILSQYVEPVYTAELLRDGGEGGRLPAQGAGRRHPGLPRLAGAGRRRRHGARPVRWWPSWSASRSTAGRSIELTPREREVLGLMAEGRTNAGIARALVVTPGAVEKHISSIFGKLDLPATDEDHRRVLAVLTYLQG